MYPQLEQPLNITLTVITAIAIAWVAFLIIDLLFVFFFRAVLRKHAKAMTVILNTKFENTKKIFSIMQEYDVVIEQRILDALNSIDSKAFKNHDSEEAEVARNTLSFLKDESTFIANKNKHLLEKPDYQLAKSNILELDSQYRNNIAMYNADVLGYNYWISALPCRFIFKMCKVKKRKIIG